MIDVSALRVTGTNNPAKQISLNWVDDILDRLERGIDLTPEDFGAVGDDVTDDGPAFAEAIAWLRDNSETYEDSFYKGSPRLRVPAKTYYLGTTTLDINHTLVIEGEGTGTDGGIPTMLRWAAGTTGIRVHAHNTEGADGSNAGGQQSGSGTILRGLYLFGAYAGTEGEYHGVQLRSRALIEDCYIYNFQGDGIFISATSGAGPGSNEGNANLWRINRVSVTGNRNGVYVNGADANAGSCYDLNAQHNRQWGIWDSSFLGNIWIAAHTSDNGLYVGATPTVVSDGVNRYSVKAGQSVGAATNAPSGTTDDNAWWFYAGVGGASPSNNIPLWTNGITVREGGSYLADEANQLYAQFINIYSEGGQGIAQTHDSNAIVFGGTSCTGNRIRANSGVIVVDDFECNGLTNDGATTLGDNLVLTNSDANHAKLQIGVGTNFGTNYFSGFGFTVECFDTSGGGTYQPYAVSGSSFKFIHNAATLIAEMDSSGIKLSAGKVLKVNGTQVVGTQGAAVADATDAATTMARLNDLLARLRTHGLIAT